MSKLLKILGLSVGISVEWILIAILVFVFAIRSSFVQTHIGGYATSYLSNELKAEFQIGAVDISLLDKIYVKNVSVKDRENGQLLFIDELEIEMAQNALFQEEIILRKVLLIGGSLNINRDAQNGIHNFQFLIDYFGSDEAKTNNKGVFKIEQIQLADLSFGYQNRGAKNKEYGVDFNHLNLNGFGVMLKDFVLDSSGICANMEALRFSEKSGFVLSEMNGALCLSDQQIKLSRLKLTTELSEIDIPLFELNYKQWSDFRSFKDSVIFNSILNDSRVALNELSYFVPSMEGMSDIVRLKGEVSNSVNNLEVHDFELFLGESYLKGDFQLPDFSSDANAIVKQYIRTAYVDFQELNNFVLPAGIEPFEFTSLMEHKFVSFADCNLKGNLNEISIDASSIESNYGRLRLPEKMVLKKDKNGWSMLPTKEFVSPLILDDFNLGAFLKREELGILSGAFRPSFRWNNSGDIELMVPKGEITHFDLNKYRISNISVGGTSIKNDRLDLQLMVNDKAVDLKLSTAINLSSPIFKGEIQINKLDIDALNYTQDSSHFIGNIKFDFNEKTDLDWGGHILCNDLFYFRGLDTLKTGYLDVGILSDEGLYNYTLESAYFDAQIKGDFNWKSLASNFYNDLAVIVPSIKVGKYSEAIISNDRSDNTVEFNFIGKYSNELLDFFVPGLYIDSTTKIVGKYNAFSRDLDLDIESAEIRMGNILISGLYGTQQFHSDSIFSDYLVDFISYKDSLKFNLIEFYTHGSEGLLESQLSWDPGMEEYSKIDWETTIHDKDHVKILLQPSFFSLDSMRWAIVNESEFSITSEDLHVEKFELNRAEQNIAIEGCLSENDFDTLYVNLENIDVAEISSILGLERSLDGLLSGDSRFTNPSDNFNYTGKLSLEGFHLAEEFIGDMALQTIWDKGQNSIDLNGDLKVDGLTTFDVRGDYFPINNNLELDLNFDNTDVSFLNALMDPELMNSISGNLDGSVHANGKWFAPKLEGDLTLADVNVKVELLGVDFSLDGKINIDEDLFAIDNLPFADPEGNIGSITGSIFHSNFLDWSYDVQLNFENDITKWRTSFPFGYEPLEQFLILDTEYKDGDSYFGKVYGRGNANISGYGENMTITVNMTTQDNTVINFPMYGSSDIDEDFDFVQFKSNSELSSIPEEKFDLTGLDLDLNFNLNPKAQLNIIFDPSIGDQILAHGSGNINMKLDPFYKIDLNGTYTISEGSNYNFAMGVIKQKFAIENGSTISWAGNPYDADINLVTSFSIPKVSLKDLAPEIVMSDQESRQMQNQKVDCYLNLDETLMAPQISFDIKAPNAPETGKTLLNEVISEESELSKQFFSLLLLRSFQPLNSSIEAHASAAKDLAESQVNALLSEVSSEYDLNFNSIMDNDLVGIDLIEFGISKRFFNDRLIVSGNFGLEEDSTSSNENSSYIPIGDLFVEYLINESGTFRATAFREADPYNVGTDESGQKPYTQGAGLSYQEDFTNIDDFKLIQYFFDIFRPKSKRRYLRKNKNKLTKIES